MAAIFKWKFNFGHFDKGEVFMYRTKVGTLVFRWKPKRMDEEMKAVMAGLIMIEW